MHSMLKKVKKKKMTKRILETRALREDVTG